MKGEGDMGKGGRDMENILIIYGQIEIIIELGDFTALSQIKPSGEAWDVAVPHSP